MVGWSKWMEVVIVNESTSHRQQVIVIINKSSSSSSSDGDHRTEDRGLSSLTLLIAWGGDGYLVINLLPGYISIYSPPPRLGQPEPTTPSNLPLLHQRPAVTSEQPTPFITSPPPPSNPIQFGPPHHHPPPAQPRLNHLESWMRMHTHPCRSTKSLRKSFWVVLGSQPALDREPVIGPYRWLGGRRKLKPW